MNRPSIQYERDYYERDYYPLRYGSFSEEPPPIPQHYSRCRRFRHSYTQEDDKSRFHTVFVGASVGLVIGGTIVAALSLVIIRAFIIRDAEMDLSFALKILIPSYTASTIMGGVAGYFLLA